MSILKYIIWLLLLGLTLGLRAQHVFTQDDFYYIEIQRMYANYQRQERHTDIRPFYVNPGLPNAKKFGQIETDNHSGILYMRAYPEFNTGGSYLSDKSRLFGEFGIHADASLNYKSHHLGLHAGADLIYTGLPDYIRSFDTQNKIIPGLGPLLTNGDYLSAWSPDISISYMAPKFIRVETGLGTQFLGDGMRSAFISDFAPPQPYIKLSTRVHNLKYTNMWLRLRDIRNLPDFSWEEAMTPQKYAAIHYLSWNPARWFSLGFFEAIVWETSDSRNFEWQYLNPVVFYRPVEFSTGSGDNAFMGLNLRLDMSDQIIMYGQFLIDDMNIAKMKDGFKHIFQPKNEDLEYGYFGNKMAFQVGWKVFDIFGIKDLYFQTEINAARPYTYSHNNVSTNWSHLNMPLAHPWGANFRESISRLYYHIWKFDLDLQYMAGTIGMDTTASHFGQDIFQATMDSYPTVSTYGNSIGQGLKTNVQFLSAELAYYLGESEKLQAFTAYYYRRYSNELENTHSHCFRIGIRTRPSIVPRMF